MPFSEQRYSTILIKPCIDAQIKGVVSLSSPALMSIDGIAVKYFTIGSHP